MTRRLIEQQSSIRESLRGLPEIRSLLCCSAEDSALYLFPQLTMTLRLNEKRKAQIRKYAGVAYGAPAASARPRWKKIGRRWVRQTTGDLPGPYFDLGIVVLCLLVACLSLLV